MKQEWEELNTVRYYEYINNIINDRGQWAIQKGVYKEGHHIIPKCFGGTGDQRRKHYNIIWLYPEEHYIAHKILAEDNSNCKKLIYAFWAMCHMSNCSNDINKIISAEEYAKLKNTYAEIKKGYKHSEESRRKMSLSRKGKKFSDSHRISLSKPKPKKRKNTSDTRKINYNENWTSERCKLHTNNVNNGCWSHANDWHKKGVYCVEYDIQFDYLKDACKWFSTISGYAFNSLRWIIKDVCNGDRESIANCHFEWR